MTSVAIIGAGCAGLGAAQELLNSGKGKVGVTLIDAFDRPGGRAWTKTDGGFPFDLGPQYIQDPGVNPWMEIAETLKFETVPSEPDTVYRILGQDGWHDTRMPPKRISEINSRLAASYASAKDWDNRPVVAQSPGSDAETQIALGSDEFGSISESAEPWQYIASDRARQVEVDKKDAGIVYVKKGLGNLVAAYAVFLAKGFEGLLKIVPGAVISRVEWRPMDGSLHLFDEYKEIATADFCIVTVPCSVLPRIAFIPPLPQERVVANGYVVLGSYKKVGFIPKIMPAAIKTNIQYYLYDYQMNGCWQYFRLPTEETALIGVASGNFAAALDGLENADVARRFIRALRAAYDDVPIEPSAEPLVTNWSKQRNICGAYSYTRYDGGDPNDPTALAARVEIAKPHADKRIMFAGEATWTDAYGTIHGAFKSGVRAARAILNLLSL